MSCFTRSLSVLTLGLVGLGLSASEFTPLASELHATWPSKHRIGVVCNAAEQQQALAVLSQAMGPEAKLLVVDTRSSIELGTAVSGLRSHQVDFVVLLPSDRMFGEGSPLRAELTRNLANFGIPCVGITAKSIQDGAFFAVGSDTRNCARIHTQPMGNIKAELPVNCMPGM